MNPVGDNRKVPVAPWRRLVVDVTPKEIRAVWDDTHLKAWPRPKLEQNARSLQNTPVAPLAFTPEFAPRQPLGLYLREGGAAFRNVVVEPLSPEE
jgi:hypothetical protein